MIIQLWLQLLFLIECLRGLVVFLCTIVLIMLDVDVEDCFVSVEILCSSVASLLSTRHCKKFILTSSNSMSYRFLESFCSWWTVAPRGVINFVTLLPCGRVLGLRSPGLHLHAGWVWPALRGHPDHPYGGKWVLASIVRNGSSIWLNVFRGLWLPVDRPSVTQRVCERAWSSESHVNTRPDWANVTRNSFITTVLLRTWLWTQIVDTTDS